MAANELVELKDQGRLVEFDNGLRGRAYFEVAVKLPDHPELDITARIEPIGDAYEVVALTLSTEGTKQALSPIALRQIPLRTIVRAAVSLQLISMNLRDILIPRDGETDSSSSDSPMLRRVALTYRVARMAGESPKKAIARHEGVSEATAIRRVAAARKAGILRADEIAQAGGARSRLEG